MLVLVGCESSSDSTPSEKTPRAAEAEPAEEPSLCRADAVADLATSLAGADVKARRDAVVGLKQACELPEEISEFLDAKDRRAQAPSTLVASLCEGNEAVLAEVETLEPTQRAKMLFDTCGLGRFGLAQRDAWLRTNPTTVLPFATMVWLEQQQIPKDDAKAIASAMLLRARRVWGLESQQVPVVGGTLAAVPADAIEVAVTPEAIYVEGAKVLDLKDGKFPKATGDDDPLEAFERALLAEREARGDTEEVTIAVVADARVRAETLLPVAGLAPKVGAASLGWVAQSEPLRFGMMRFDVSNRFRYGHPKLGIDEGGFTLTPPDGGTKQHVGAEDADNPYDFEALATKAEDYAETKPDVPREVMIDAAEDTSAGVLLSTIHQLHGPDCASDSTACWFDSVTVKQGFDPEMVARNAGILGVLSSESGAFLASPYGSAFDVDPDEEVWGGLIGSEIGEGFGVGGLGLVGEGRGGGGTGEGTIGLGSTGLIGKGGGGKKVPRVRQSKAKVKGALDKDIIRRIVRAHISQVRYCYEVGLKKDEELAGRVVIDFTIGTDGSVSKAEVDSTTVDDEAVGTCIAKKVKRWKFPKPPGAGIVLVSYPFVLSPG